MSTISSEYQCELKQNLQERLCAHRLHRLVLEGCPPANVPGNTLNCELQKYPILSRLSEVT